VCVGSGSETTYVRVPECDNLGSGEWSCCFSYTEKVLEAGEGVLVNGDGGELSTTKGEWNDRAGIENIGFVRCESVRVCLARERIVVDMMRAS